MPQQPPITPSPHRFLTGQRHSEQPAKAPKPSPALRHQVTKDVPVPNQQTPNTSSQFAATPRFSFSKAKSKPPIQRSPSPQKHSLINALRSTGRPTDDVEDVSNQAEDDEMLDLEQNEALPTTEHGEDREWTNDLAFSPKRRRLNDDQRSQPAHPSAFKRPQEPASRSFRTVPPGEASQAHSEDDATSTGFMSAQRPTFLRPSAPPQAPTEPLPETFSPHKRGQKFVPGGMAATVQQWVIETGQAAAQSRKGHGYLKGEDYMTRVKVDEVLGQGPFTATGKDTDGSDVSILLAGRHHADPEAAKFNEGELIGIRAPTWDVEIEGSSWSVGVDWRVLS